MATKLPRLTITLSPRSYEFLSEMAKIQKTSKAKVLDRMIEQGLAVSRLLLEWDVNSPNSGDSTHG
jgi:hypothetical protein